MLTPTVLLGIGVTVAVLVVIAVAAIRLSMPGTRQDRHAQGKLRGRSSTYSITVTIGDGTSPEKVQRVLVQQHISCWGWLRNGSTATYTIPRAALPRAVGLLRDAGVEVLSPTDFPEARPTRR